VTVDLLDPRQFGKTELVRPSFRISADSGQGGLLDVKLDNGGVRGLDVRLPTAGTGQAGFLAGLETITTLFPMEQIAAHRTDVALHPPLGIHHAPAREFARMVRSVSASALVYAGVADRVLDLWVVLPEDDENIQRGIAGAFCQLMRSYPGLSFDFMIIEAETSSAHTLGDSGYIPVSPF
jgi:hypothetical protein